MREARRVYHDRLTDLDTQASKSDDEDVRGGHALHCFDVTSAYIRLDVLYAVSYLHDRERSFRSIWISLAVILGSRRDLQLAGVEALVDRGLIDIHRGREVCVRHKWS